MKNLVLGALLAAAVSSAACGTSSNTSAVITANWSFKQFNPAGAAGCPVGYDTVAIYARPWDPFVGDFVASADPPDLFNCSDLQGTTLPLDGVFQVWVQVESHDQTQIFVQSGSVVIDTADGDATIGIKPIYIDAGYLDFAWALSKNGAHVHCSDVNVGNNGIATTVVDANFMITDKFDCTDGFGTTDALPAADDFVLTVTATDTSSRDWGASGPIDLTITKPPYPGGLTTLSSVVQVDSF